MSTTEELIGEITKVEDSYAYASTEKGDVYIGISLAKISGIQTNMSLIEFFAFRDQVLITAAPQDGRNNCKYTALKVRKLAAKTENSELFPPLSTEIITQVNAIVVSVESSFGFAHADKYETVFLPGIAFDPSIVSSIDTYIRPQDQVVLKIQAQNEYKGCKWKAVEVVKQFKVNKEEEDIVYTSCGIVSAVTDDHVLLYDETHGVDVTCSILTYVGGLRGNKTAKVLSDLIHDQEEIMYKAELTLEPTRQALEWKQVKEFDSLANMKGVRTTESFTQTVASVAELICRTALDKPEIRAQFAGILDELPTSALPSSLSQQQTKDRYGV